MGLAPAIFSLLHRDSDRQHAHTPPPPRPPNLLSKHPADGHRGGQKKHWPDASPVICEASSAMHQDISMTVAMTGLTQIKVAQGRVPRLVVQADLKYLVGSLM